MKIPPLNKSTIKAIIGMLFFGAGFIVSIALALKELALLPFELIAAIAGSDLISNSDVLLTLFLLMFFSFLVAICSGGFKSFVAKLPK
ncbi:hypothetical protein I5495_18015 [Citrobacter amalonaticus]|uniref:hypothetical protein n=1 Tax=Citrobacter amalonaticus TaxID=35703 RepID=UPI001904BBFF|nr:hypothetical protein [Citrobacter amalonaticus]MBJ9259231.1 hypothetical protein [Citrobacter amalonaticus]